MNHSPESHHEITPEIARDSLAVIQDVFRRYRPVLLERAGKVAHFDDKTDGSPVTDTDLEIEQALQTELARRFPGIPVFGEEAGYDDKQLPPAFWLVDPLDGTKAFIENRPSFTCMAVLIQNREATVSAIYNPSTNDMFTAKKGEGAYKNGVRLDLEAMPLPRTALCKEYLFKDVNPMLAPKGVSCVEMSAGGGYGFTMVAEGRAAARFNLHGGGYTHDYAPGGLLVREAGGVLVPFMEDEYTFETRSFVACHPELASTIRSHIGRLRELELANPKRRS